jgi:hypothetical protein
MNMETVWVYREERPGDERAALERELQTLRRRVAEIEARLRALDARR